METLQRKRVSEYTEDASITRLAEGNKDIAEILFAIHYLKAQKESGTPFMYSKYVEYSKQQNDNDYINESLFSFIGSKVFASRRPIVAGQKDKIYMFKYGLVDGVFLRRYDKGQIFQVGDNVVFTTHSNTELLSGTYQHIFGAVFQ